MGDSSNANLDASSFDWTNISSWPVEAFDLQDAFDVELSPLAASNPTLPSLLETQTSTRGSVNDIPRPAKEADAFQTFRNLTDVVFSRPSSPDAIQAKDRWFSSSAEIDGNVILMNDQDILNNFLSLFNDHIAGWFSLFRNQTIRITGSTRKEWYLLMASVGGLFSKQRGSNRLARSLYHSGRQHLLSFVNGYALAIRSPGN